MIPKIEFNPKNFYIYEAIAKKSGNMQGINRILEDLVSIEAVLEYAFKSRDGTEMPLYEINEAGEFLPARGLQAKVFHLIKDRFNNEDEGIPYALIIMGCGDKAKVIKHKVIVARLQSALVGFYGESDTINSFYLARYMNTENKSLGF